MFYFIVFTIIFLLAHGAFMDTFFNMIAPNGMLDITLKWQRMLERLYNSEHIAFNLLGKALGDCERCACFWAGGLWTAMYYLCVSALGFWQIESTVANIIWLWVVWVSNGTYSLWFVNKLK